VGNRLSYVTDVSSSPGNALQYEKVTFPRRMRYFVHETNTIIWAEDLTLTETDAFMS
jgi:hypothetical protein